MLFVGDRGLDFKLNAPLRRPPAQGLATCDGHGVSTVATRAGVAATQQLVELRDVRHFTGARRARS